MFDVGCRVREAINGWFEAFVASAINPVFGMLGESLLTTPRLDRGERVRGLWSGSLAVANTCVVLLVVVGGLTLMANPTMQTSYTVKDIAPRLVVGVVLANLSLLLVGKAIGFANGLSHGLLASGVRPEAAADTLVAVITRTVVAPSEVGIFFTLVTLGAVVLGLILALIFLVRVMVTTLLIAAAPLALVCHALPQTETLARMWWRAFAGVLAIQVGQALVFITAARVFLTTDIRPLFGVHTVSGQFDLWITICLLYVLIRIPAWISRMVWRGGLKRSPIARTAQTVAALVVFRGLLGKTRGAGTAAAASRRPHRPGHGGPPQRPGPRPGGPAPAGGPPRSGPQPRWAHPTRRWTPPDPEWHATVTGPQASGSLAQQQRWRDPARRWTPPDNAAMRRTRPQRPAPSAQPQSRQESRPADPRRPWTPPDNPPWRSARPTWAAPRQPVTPPRRRYAPPDPQRPWTPPDAAARRSAPATSAQPRPARRPTGGTSRRTDQHNTRSNTNRRR